MYVIKLLSESIDGTALKVNPNANCLHWVITVYITIGSLMITNVPSGAESDSEAVLCGAGAVKEFSVTSPQFCYEDKTGLKTVPNI